MFLLLGFLSLPMQTTGAIVAMDGEKDPRNLITCFWVATFVLTQFPHSVLNEFYEVRTTANNHRSMNLHRLVLSLSACRDLLLRAIRFLVSTPDLHRLTFASVSVPLIACYNDRSCSR
jgi:hypothetical protein